MYRRIDKDAPLEQGEIFDDCPTLYWTLEAGIRKATESIERVIVLSQACDLANTKTTRVQVALVHEAEKLVRQGIVTPNTIRDQLVRHRIFGWYFLPSCENLPESVVDFRDIHTVPRELLEDLAVNNKRVCAVVTPYREHLAQHFAVTFSRIGLPEPYQSEP